MYSKPYIPVIGKQGQYTSSLSSDQGVTFYKDLSNAKANGNQLGRRMETKGRGAELTFLPTSKQCTNRIRISVVDGIRKVVISCENRMLHIIARFRDFFNGEVVDIPWSCALETPSIRIRHIMMDYLEQGTLIRVSDLMTFADSSTIEDTPVVYMETNWEKNETSINIEESSSPLTFLVTMVLLFITASSAAIALLCYFWRWNSWVATTENTSRLENPSTHSISSIESGTPVDNTPTHNTSSIESGTPVDNTPTDNTASSEDDSGTIADQPCTDNTASSEDDSGTIADQPCTVASPDPEKPELPAGMVKTGGGHPSPIHIPPGKKGLAGTTVPWLP
jgi:hypothetical protein